MKSQLYAKEVITNDQRKFIDIQVGRNKMDHLIIDIIIPSLRAKFSKKYKSFLKVMEENDDTDLQSAAEKLGRLINIYCMVGYFQGGKFHNFVKWTYFVSNFHMKFFYLGSYKHAD